MIRGPLHAATCSVLHGMLRAAARLMARAVQHAVCRMVRAPCVVGCGALRVCAARVGKGRTLRCPSVGAMHSYAGHRGRRDPYGQGHRAVRRCDDIRHRRSMCSAGRRCESGRMRYGGGCRRTGCAADCNGRGCVGCVQASGGGVILMVGGAVTLKGVTISNSGAVRAHPLRSHVPRPSLENSCVTLHCCA